MISRLPPKPDFESIETAALESADRRTMLLALIGNLSFSWSNNESMFIYVLMLLLDTDEVSAAIVFSTLNTTRARLDLIQRLALIRIGQTEVRDELDGLIERFTVATRLRNEFNHAMFMLNAQGDITHTQSLRIVERRGQFKFGETRKVDQARIDEMSAAIHDLRDLNRDLWDFLPRLQASVPTRAAPER
ncbi:hypothetical protein AUC70_12980 [Methyloceanibacter stevinii]|uniref:Uncharacterized protein n=2 Tax=Methyloceanibacter stevinii TaxID=1774970 RepID=A0A1E3VUQ1_9HYPH|nr:hypothetical protein AUC70_12980 [Methyloceanibacter stevinii]